MSTSTDYTNPLAVKAAIKIARRRNPNLIPLIRNRAGEGVFAEAMALISIDRQESYNPFWNPEEAEEFNLPDPSKGESEIFVRPFDESADAHHFANPKRRVVKKSTFISVDRYSFL